MPKGAVPDRGDPCCPWVSCFLHYPILRRQSNRSFLLLQRGFALEQIVFDTPYSFSYLNLELHHKEKKTQKKTHTKKNPTTTKNKQTNKQTNKTKPCAKAELESLGPVQIFSPSPTTCFLTNEKM